MERKLHDAASLGRVDAVRGSLDSGVAVDGSILSGRTALQAACEFGHVDVVTLLLDRGASVDRADQHGYTPLHRACLEDGSAEVVRLLLARGADFERTNEQGSLPLHVACSAGRSIAARLLLDLGTEVDRTNGEGATPMWVACREGQHTTVRLCLERGADINWARVGSTMQDVCRINEYEVMEGWLARIRAVGWTRYLSEPRYKLVVLKELVARGRARRERAFHGKELLLYLLFPSGHSRGHPRLPDELFAVIVRYYWGGGLSVEEEAAAAAETAEREAEWAAFAESNESEDSAGDYYYQ